MMKYSVPNKLLLFVFVSLPLVGKSSSECTIVIEPKWYDLEKSRQDSGIFGGKWILAGSITFRKKSKDTVYLSKLTLRWRGKRRINNLLGSLYRKNLDKQFLPIEEFLLSDSNWNKKKQTLVFNFHKSIYLGPTNIFYLVLTVPEQLEEILKQGSFLIEAQSLPTPFKLAARHHPLTLAFRQVESLETQSTIA